MRDWVMATRDFWVWENDARYRRGCQSKTKEGCESNARLRVVWSLVGKVRGAAK
jgi:hypothetical protein